MPLSDEEKQIIASNLTIASALLKASYAFKGDKREHTKGPENETQALFEDMLRFVQDRK